MIVSIFNDHQLFLDLDVLGRLKNNISVHDRNIICKRRNITVAFGILMQDIPNGTYSFEKLNSNEISFGRISDVVADEKPSITGEISECKTLECSPMIGQVLSELTNRNFSPIVASIIKTRRMGREVICFPLEYGFFITSGNLNILVNEGCNTCNKFVQGIPEERLVELTERAVIAGISVNSLILSKLKNPPALISTASKVRKKSTVNKMVQGIPDEHMLVLKEQAKSSGISVNRLMLNLIGVTPPSMGTAPRIRTCNKLLTRIPLPLMDTVRTNAAALGLSVNKYILEVLKND